MMQTSYILPNQVSCFESRELFAFTANDYALTGGGTIRI